MNRGRQAEAISIVTRDRRTMVLWSLHRSSPATTQGRNEGPAPVRGIKRDVWGR